MTREKLLSLRANNLLSLALGVPALIFVIAALAASNQGDRASFIGVLAIGALF